MSELKLWHVYPYDSPEEDILCMKETSAWVSIKDRLPEDGGYVLVTDGDDVYTGFKDDSWGSYFMNVESPSMICSEDITHWMPSAVLHRGSDGSGVELLTPLGQRS